MLFLHVMLSDFDRGGGGGRHLLLNLYKVGLTRGT